MAKTTEITDFNITNNPDDEAGSTGQVEVRMKEDGEKDEVKWVDTLEEAEVLKADWENA
jgi:hypothetical protein|tara:strand:- start:33 stop:209 length:177 start_codon:yes stop_codon:yes gene_type:complete